jgi:uncharacterized protein involved in outer membrane biogenesis
MDKEEQKQGRKEASPDAPGKARAAHRHPLLAAGAFVGLLIVFIILIWDWNWFKKPVERRISAATGRAFHINGDLSVKLDWWTPRISFERITLGNLPGNREPQMASADLLQFRLHLKPLVFQHDWELSDVKLSRPHLLLEKNRAGIPNWIFPKGKSEFPKINQLSVDAGKLEYRNPLRRTDMDFDVRSGAPGKDARSSPLVFTGGGKYVGNAVEIEGRVDSPLALKDAARPYRIQAKGHAGPTHASADGFLIAPLQFKGFDLKFGLSGPNLALLFPLTGIATPDTPPYRLLGQLRHEKDVWEYQDFTGVVGDSDLSGDAKFLTGRARPKLIADLVSKHLDFDDLGGFIGRAPQTGGGESASPEQKAQRAQQMASARVLPDDPFHLEKIRRMDADVKLRARHIETRRLPVEAMTAHLFVDDGVLRLDPLDSSAAAGQVRSTIRMDARGKVIASSAKVHAEGLSLPKLFPGWEITEDSTGRLGGNLALSGNGNSIARMLATSSGNVDTRMGQGRISNLLMEKAGIDIQEIIKFLVTKDRTIPVRCAFGEFDVKAGVMRSRALAFDTTDTVILGEGTISLRDESLNLRLKPLPKDHSFLALRAPLMLTGSFKDPDIHPDTKKITLRAVAAALLATITPPAALIATYETGPGKDVSCRPGQNFAAAQKKWTSAAKN